MFIEELNTKPADKQEREINRLEYPRMETVDQYLSPGQGHNIVKEQKKKCYYRSSVIDLTKLCKHPLCISAVVAKVIEDITFA